MKPWEVLIKLLLSAELCTKQTPLFPKCGSTGLSFGLDASQSGSEGSVLGVVPPGHDDEEQLVSLGPGGHTLQGSCPFLLLCPTLIHCRSTGDGGAQHWLPNPGQPGPLSA